jgi:hypothetical protein
MSTTAVLRAHRRWLGTRRTRDRTESSHRLSRRGSSVLSASTVAASVSSPSSTVSASSSVSASACRRSSAARARASSARDSAWETACSASASEMAGRPRPPPHRRRLAQRRARGLSVGAFTPSPSDSSEIRTENNIITVCYRPGCSKATGYKRRLLIPSLIFSEEENFLTAYAKLSRCDSSWQWLPR